MELNREQIINALECCSNDTGGCPDFCPLRWDAQCMQDLAENALDLITSQEQRIKELTEINSNLEDSIACLETECEIARAKIEELTEENERLRDFIKKQFKSAWTAREDAVRKMQESLYRELASLGVKDKFNKEFFLTKVDKIAKEILEGEK